MRSRNVFTGAPLQIALAVVLTLGFFGTTVVDAVEFTTQHEYAVGSVPFFVASGDVNGDGKSDLIIANGGGQTVSVLINRTQAGSSVADFAEQQEFLTNLGPATVAVTDINQDGRLDLVAASFNGRIAVLLNTAEPGATTASFAPFFQFDGIAEVRSLAIADMNNDGKADVVTNIEAISAASVWINTTMAGASVPSFESQQNFDAGWTPMAVIASDINGDGKIDMVAGNNCYQTIGVLMNQTEPGSLQVTLSPPQQFSTGTCAFYLASGDLNGDSKPDVVIGNPNLDSISVLINDTGANAVTASFNSPQVFGAGERPIGVLVSDINGDGRLDLLSANYDGSSVSVIVNTTVGAGGAVSFAEHQEFSVGTGTRTLVSADLNGDGLADVGTANSSGNSASVLINTTPPFNLLFTNGFDQ